MSREADPLLTAGQVAQMCRRTANWLAKVRMTGSGPRFLKIGGKIFYRQSAVEAWLASLERGSTSERMRAS